MELDKGVVRWISRPAVVFVAGGYLGGYVLVQYSGLFSLPPDNIMRVLHRWPALLGAGMLMLAGLAGVSITLRRTAGNAVQGMGSLASWAGSPGILLIGAGILVSALARFEGSITLHETQAMTLSETAFDAGTVYHGRYSRKPSGSLFIKEMAPFPHKGNSSLWLYAADALYRKEPSSPPRELRIGSTAPSFADGFTYRIRDIGYSPHLFLFDLSGNSILDIYAVMRLFPAGAEDSFRFDKIIPHTFYLRYYPDVPLVSATTADLGIKSGPVYQVRIVRNLDLLVDGYAAPDEIMRFDSLLLSVGDSKRWLRIQIVRDPGMFLVIPGLVLIIYSAIAAAVRRYVMKGGL